MVQYKPAPLREHAWVLRNALRETLAEIGTDDVDLLAKVVIGAWREHRDNIGAAWILILIPKPLAAAVLTATYTKAPEVAKWLMYTLYKFAEDIEAEPKVFEADLIKAAGPLPGPLEMMQSDTEWVTHPEAAANQGVERAR